MVAPYLSLSLSRLWAPPVCIWYIYISACSIQERGLKTWGYLIKRHAICAGCVPSEIRHTADLNDIDVTLANTSWNNADVCRSLTIGWKFTTHPYPQINIAEHIKRTLEAWSAIYVRDDLRKWDTDAHTFSFAIRTSVNRKTGDILA